MTGSIHFNAQPIPLQEKTLLQNRFVVGPPAGNPTEFLINYYGIDNQTARKVIIRELYPGQMVRREENRTGVDLVDKRFSQTFTKTRAKFVAQARKYPIVDSPNIVSGVAVFEENGTAYQVMDHVAGATLSVYLSQKGGKLSEEEALKLLVPILDGMKLIHDAGRTHGFIQPEAIRIDKGSDDYYAVLMNLGIPPKTGLNVFPGFTSPETSSDANQISPVSDIYSIGAILHYMLTGETPPSASVRQQSFVLPALDAQGTSIPSYLKKAIRKAMSIPPNKRFETVSALKAALLDSGFDEKERQNTESILDDSIEFADESLFEGIEEAEGDVSFSSSGRKPLNVKVLLIILAANLVLFLMPLWLFIIAPLMALQDAMENQFFEEFQQGMEEFQEMQNQEMNTDSQTQEQEPETQGHMTLRERDVYNLMQQGHRSYAAGDAKGAIAAFEKASSLMPNDPEPYLALGTVYKADNQPDLAVKAFEKVLRLDPNNGSAYGSLALIYFETNKEMRSYDYFRKAIELKDQNSVAVLQALAERGNKKAQEILLDQGYTW